MREGGQPASAFQLLQSAVLGSGHSGQMGRVQLLVAALSFIPRSGSKWNWLSGELQLGCCFTL